VQSELNAGELGRQNPRIAIDLARHVIAILGFDYAMPTFQIRG